MEFKHLGIVHLVNVITRENQCVIKSLLVEGVKVLEDSVRGSSIPIVPVTLLSGGDLDELIKVTPHHVPTLIYMSAERLLLVLGENVDAAQAGIEAVG
jgi:hypothetical protein